MSPLVRRKFGIPFYDKEGVCWKCGSFDIDIFSDELEQFGITYYYNCVKCDTEGFQYYDIKFRYNSST